MILYGKIIDANDSTALSGTTVEVYNSVGIFRGIRTAAKSNGYFEINSTAIAESDLIKFTNAEYKTLTVRAYDIFVDMSYNAGEGSLISLEPDTKTNSEVIVYSGGNKKNNSLLYIGLGLLAVAVMDNKKKKVTGINDAYNKFKRLPKPIKYATLAAGGLGIYAIINYFGRHSKPGETPEAAQAELGQLASQGITPTFSEYQFKSWADSIRTQFNGCDLSFGTPWRLTESGQTIYDIVKQFKNDADFLMLITVYGVRMYDQCGPFTGNFKGNLYAAVKDELASDEIKTINSKLASNNITYRF